MKNWENKKIDLGTIKVGTKNTVIFKADTDLEIDHISTSCGCTSAKYHKKNKTLSAVYIPKSIPAHLISEGEYRTVKSIRVYYKNGEEDTLQLMARIIN